MESLYFAFFDRLRANYIKKNVVTFDVKSAFSIAVYQVTIQLCW